MIPSSRSRRRCLHSYFCIMPPIRSICTSRIRPLIVLIWLLAGTAPPAAAQRYPFYNLGIDNGLIQSQATALVQDRQGHLWIGTLGGLSRYDGRTFTNYTVRDGLPSNTVNALHLDRQGRLWIGTMKGVSLYDGKQFRHYIFQSPENPRANIVSKIRSTPDGTVWCVSGNKLYQIREGKVQSVPMPGGASLVSAMSTDDRGDGWLTVPGRPYLYRLHGRQWDSTLISAGKMAAYVYRIFEDRQHRLWLLAGSELYVKQGDSIRLATAAGRPLNDLPRLMCMTQARDNSYWLGVGSGAIHLTDSTVRRYSKRNGLTDNTIATALSDAEGNIWLGSDGQGLFRFSGAPFTVLDESTGLPSAQVMSLAADADGTIYLGTFDAGIYRYKSGHITTLPLPRKDLPPITSMMVLGRRLWFGTRGHGLWSYENGSFRQYSYKTNHLTGDFITAMRADSEQLWIGTNSGFAVYAEDSFHRVPLKSGPVMDFIRIGADSMLLATEDGLRLYNQDEVRPFATGTAMDSASVQCFTLKGRELWMGTNDNGVICYHLDRHRSITISKAQGLRSDFVYNIIADRAGTIWAGTGFGIYNIRMEAGQPMVTYYGKGQGVSGLESNHNAVLGMPDGSIWFGTTNGALHYRPGRGMTTTHPVSIVLQSVLLFGETIRDTGYFKGTSSLYGVPGGLKLPYKKNNLSFTFHAISLNGEEGIVYRYLMDGLDAQWSDWAPTNSVTYSALPPGKYTLRVQCGTDTERPAHELKYDFEIITPFHKTSLFRLLVLGGCILLGVSLQYGANRRKQARLKLIEALRREEQAKVRQRTAEDFHDEVGNKLTRINVLTNVLKSKITEITPDARRIIEQIQDNTGQLYSGTRDILWSLKPSNDNLYEILHRIRDFGGDLFGDTNIDFRFSGTDERWKDFRMPMDLSRNLIMIFKEALNNCLKYAEPTLVTLDASLSPDNMLRLVLRDNGKGFDPEQVKRGHGIDNMNVRAKRLNGKLCLTSEKCKGTTLELTFKIPSNKV